MNQRRRSRRFCTRPLRIESMEGRRLLSAELGWELDQGVVEAAFVSASSQHAGSTQDAGSTRATALDLGSIDGAARIGGQVSWRDTLDVFRFDVARSADVDVSLDRLGRNADLFLVNSSGQLIEASQSSGNRSENLSLNLDAGTYFVAVQSRSFWGTSYQLSVSAELVPETISLPESKPELDPTDEVDRSAPLADVAYFGGSREWNVNAVAAPESWAAGYTGQGILVAVVDTGVDLDHPDLAGNIYVNPGEIAGNGIDDDGNGFVDDVNGYDFAGRDADPDDPSGHGTHVAGTIAAVNNGFGATGIAPDATILPVRVLGDNGSGSTSAVAAGIRYAADLGADIINLSLGGGYSRAIDAAIDYARSLGSLIVAAAGNEYASTPGYPARFSATDQNVISVGAYSSSGALARFSNDVGNSGSIQIDAPGVGIYSTYAGGRYASLSGTSMASPHVAGVAALALSANPNLAPDQLRSLLVGGSIDAASGSDARGSLTAATTVAYAARGFTSPPIGATNNGATYNGATNNVATNNVTATGRSSDTNRTTSLPTAEFQPITPSTAAATTPPRDRDPVSTIHRETAKRSVSEWQSTDRIAVIDAYFAEDASDHDDSTIIAESVDDAAGGLQLG